MYYKTFVALTRVSQEVDWHTGVVLVMPGKVSDISERDLRSCEVTLAVTNKAQKKF